MTIKNLSDTELVVSFARLESKITKDINFKGKVSQKTENEHTRTIKEMAKRFNLDYDVLVSKLND